MRLLQIKGPSFSLAFLLYLVNKCWQLYSKNAKKYEIDDKFFTPVKRNQMIGV